MATSSSADSLVILSLVTPLAMTTMPEKMIRMQLTTETEALWSFGVEVSKGADVGFDMVVVAVARDSSCPREVLGDETRAETPYCVDLESQSQTRRSNRPGHAFGFCTDLH